MKYLVFGSINIDLLFSVEHIVREGETAEALSLAKSAGGKGANQAAALAKAGLDVYLAGKAGGDGDYILDFLRSYGVNTDFVARCDGGTGQAIIQIDKNAQNSILLYAGGNALIEREEVEGALASFGKGDVLLLQNEISMNREIMEGARARGMKIFLNPSPYNKKIESLPLDVVDVFFVNEIEAAALAGIGGIGEDADFQVMLDVLLRRFPRAEVVLTAGKNGAFYGAGAQRVFAPSVPVSVVDTTCAGDTFSGYFLAARSRSFGIEGALKIASKAASLTVSRRGAMEAVPYSNEVFE